MPDQAVKKKRSTGPSIKVLVVVLVLVAVGGGELWFKNYQSRKRPLVRTGSATNLAPTRELGEGQLQMKATPSIPAIVVESAEILRDRLVRAVPELVKRAQGDGRLDRRTFWQVFSTWLEEQKDVSKTDREKFRRAYQIELGITAD